MLTSSLPTVHQQYLNSLLSVSLWCTSNSLIAFDKITEYYERKLLTDMAACRFELIGCILELQRSNPDLI